MIDMKQFMELVNYKITEGDNYLWQCYGPNSYQLSSWNGLYDEGGWSFNIIFSTKSQKVYEVAVCDYTNSRAYRLINPKYVEKHRKEAEQRDVLFNQAWDDVDYIDLETDEDFIQKSKSIIAGEAYDTRVQVPVDFSDEELLQYMKLAHERDMTFNEFIEEALRHAIREYEEGRLTREDAQVWLSKQNEIYSDED